MVYGIKIISTVFLLSFYVYLLIWGCTAISTAQRSRDNLQESAVTYTWIQELSGQAWMLFSAKLSYNMAPKECFLVDYHFYRN